MGKLTYVPRATLNVAKRTELQIDDACSAVSENLIFPINYHNDIPYLDRLCGLVVRVLGYRSGGPGSIPCTTRKKK
jgi:hypothetical protein